MIALVVILAAVWLFLWAAGRGIDRLYRHLFGEP